jgi:hypothetical protein
MQPSLCYLSDSLLGAVAANLIGSENSQRAAGNGEEEEEEEFALGIRHLLIGST